MLPPNLEPSWFFHIALGHIMDLDDAVFTSEPISIASIGRPCSAADDIELAVEPNGTAANMCGGGTLCNSSACFEGMGVERMCRLQWV